MRQRLALVLLLFAVPAVAQIYKYTDANGNTAYSNQPPNGTKAEAVELPPLNSVEAVAPSSSQPSGSQKQSQTQQNTAAYEVLALSDLPEGEALRANNGTFTVGVAIQPRLQAGHLLQLVIDGTPYGQPTNVPRIQVVELDRGEHTLAVQVLEGAQTIQQSQPTTLTVQRVHAGKP